MPTTDPTRIVVPGTKSTPSILLDPATGHFEFSGSSMPENAAEFFSPVIDWLGNVLPGLPASTFVFRLDYFSTSSMKAFYLILKRIAEARTEEVQHRIHWQIEDNDEFMVEAADSFEELLNTTIERIPMDNGTAMAASEALQQRIRSMSQG